MEIFLFSANALLPMFLQIALGWFLLQRGIIKNENIKFINDLAFKCLIPFHIFNSTYSINYYIEFNLKLILTGALSITLTMIVAWIIFSITIKDRARRAVYILSSFKANFIVLALPISANLFGDAGIKAAAMLVPQTIII